jgi:DNA polymerase-3 subunit gamma/tau
MSYLVLARKYRPQTFGEVIDQDPVIRTLTNAIASDRVAHAVLFAGPRGTGKTTVARILAKAMNCSQGPTAMPCNRCRSCGDITAGSAVDVFEIDGASNNSVDQVRELRDNVKYMPAQSAYKIYIIDEVHMLSIPAFNALLKTLEEPPAHIKFFFATTEPNKIPITILSRCQRHDFKRIQIDSMTAHMQAICEKENFQISPENLAMIARETGGSMRDALSLLDQVITCADGPVDDKQVMDLLGIIDRQMIFDIAAALFTGDATAVLEILEEVYERGHDMKRLHADLLEHFRHLLIVKMAKNVPRLVDLPTHEIEQMQRQAGEVTTSTIRQVFDMLFQEESRIRFSTHPKLAMEMAIFRLLEVKPALPIEVLIEKLDRLRVEMQHRSPPSAPGNPAGGDAGGPSGKKTPPRSEPPVDLSSAWEQIQQSIASDHPSLAANLSRCTPKRLADDHIELEVSGNGFHLGMIQRPGNREIIEKVCGEVFANTTRITVTSRSEPGADSQKKQLVEKRKEEALNHPLVTDALEIFNGRVVDVKLNAEDGS